MDRWHSGAVIRIGVFAAASEAIVAFVGGFG